MNMYKLSSTLISLIAISSLLLLHCTNAQDQIVDYLNGHNFARLAVGNKPLKWDPVLAKFAHEWGSKHLETCQLVHCGCKYGENLGYSPILIYGLDIVSMFIEEKRFYDWESNSCIGGECGHYLQAIWNTTTHVGCAKLRCKNNGTWIGCNYNPPPAGQRGFYMPAAGPKKLGFHVK